ncbi:hypothetical protein [Ectothiorhodospira lacustris]|uniref:hypothetical protein n=1 Tax=Ectothiorhodospira lacustris TaxID=2899127 RepID=UPI001EE99F14|nr:hypothetical protein [Ectothiorhodospira lacustris]MCG5500889.1 hypothetical protein [Ectothiorhodospira lacustris]MCG5511377.1 hypothetical protein [Ectothiorhodospira lacustris]MCG5523222.1 hypothetical protein [Ectothiorhodospira lacustris]
MIPPVSTPVLQPTTRSAAPVPAVPDGEAAGVLADKETRLNEHQDYRIIRQVLLRDQPKLEAGAGASPEASSSSSEPASPSGSPASGAAPDRGVELQWQQLGVSRLDVNIRGTETGEAVRIRFESVRMERLQISLGGAPQQADPLVLDLGGEGITTTGVDRGARFDITGDGRQEQVSFVAGNSWFLALDRNDNGVIDDGRELFGDQHGAAHGFEELAKFDDNGDGVINAQDSVFERLRLFQMGADGSQRLKTLEEAGVAAIHLGYDQTARALNAYDVVAQQGQFERTDGSRGEASDVLLGYRDLTA